MENTTSREGLGQDPVASDEELARVHARNDWQIAADRALADIRRRSREGKLTTPDRWVKRAFAPEGVDPRAFAADLLAYIEEHPHAEDTPAMGKQELPLGYDDRPELDDLDLDDPLPEPGVVDIVLLYGKSGTYMYSKPPHVSQLRTRAFQHGGGGRLGDLRGCRPYGIQGVSATGRRIRLSQPALSVARIEGRLAV